jgi:MSHA biogenesis protein MshP
MKRIRSIQRGFAAIAAIFLVVVLAALGGFMLTFSNTQQLTSAQDVQGSRAYWTARAGLEWGIASVVAASACPAPSTTKTIDGFSVVTRCSAQGYNESGITKTIYTFESIGSVGAVGGIGYVERSLSASVEL